jgi:hypothetical protein
MPSRPYIVFCLISLFSADSALGATLCDADALSPRLLLSPHRISATEDPLRHDLQGRIIEEPPPLLGLERDVESTVVSVDPLGLGARGTFVQVNRLSFHFEGRPYADIHLRYDALGQLNGLTIDAAEPHEDLRIADHPMDLGGGRTLHIEYFTGRAPRIWIAAPGEPNWIFSGYDLTENSQQWHVTVSHFQGARGTIIPALESFDHDDMVAYLTMLGLPGNDVTAITVDYHPDDRKGMLFLHIGNWATYAKGQHLLSEVLWLKPAAHFSTWFRGVIDQAAVDPNDIKPTRNSVVITYDADYFSPNQAPRSAPEIRQLIHRVVGRFSLPDIRGKIRAVHFVRSALSRVHFEDYTPREQSNFLLNAMVSEHLPFLGRIELRRVPHHGVSDAQARLTPKANRPKGLGLDISWWPQGKKTPSVLMRRSN